ncbi:MAG: hydrolase [Nocardioidaceae bacterium]|nr:hydrolase [Nocardioidaceae bacterium]
MTPGDHDDDTPDDAGQNPFAGTPMEQMFAAFSGGQMPDMNAIMAQMQRMFEPHEGSVNFTLAKDVARQALAAAGPDPSPNTAQVGAVSDAMRLAESWLDGATSIASGAHTVAAWSRAEWIEETAPTWQRVIEPIAAHVVVAMGEALPDEAKSMAGPLMGIIGQAGGAMFGQQIGQALAGLATEVMSSTDVGLPLGPQGVGAILPENVRAFGEGLGVSQADVLLYVSLREAAHHRLFSHAMWLRSALVGAIEEYGRGTTIDIAAIEAQIRGIDPSRPEEIQDALSQGLFEPERSPAQQAALTRLEDLLAFIEGWVDEVVTQATRDRMPSAAALAEAIRRRRAAGGPAEETFAALVGLELRPRRLREAATLWAALRDRQGTEARDAVWSHPDLMPTGLDLDDPLGFAQGETTQEAQAGDDFDSELEALLKGEDPGEA